MGKKGGSDVIDDFEIDFDLSDVFDLLADGDYDGIRDYLGEMGFTEEEAMSIVQLEGILE